MSEHHIQNDVRNALAGKAKVFRANVGQAWTGDVTRLDNGDVLIRNPRPFNTGLPPGFPDLFGWRTEVITPDMLGQKVARFISVEMKSATGRKRTNQENFAAAITRDGGRGGFARSVEDAERIALG